MIKRYKAVFSSLHTLYRLTHSFIDPKDFVLGVSKLYKNIFKADKVILVCKISNFYNFIKVQLYDKKQMVKKGGISILSKREKDILQDTKEIILDTRLICPLVFIEPFGIVYIKRKTKNDIFDDLEKRWFISISEQVSVYIKIYNLYQEQRKTILNYIKSLTTLLNQYIPTSHLHPKSTAKLIRMLSKELKLSSSEIKSLEYASLLHDAGKLHIPSTLLTKQYPLTDKEYKLIMKHPRKGVELIKELELLKPVIPIILHHHERYDGKGYPSHLKKEEIPLGSRILAVIDAFDAMFFGRPYKKNMSLEEVERELYNQKEKQFDPKIIDCFIKILNMKDTKKYLNSLR
ncbi:MAG: HD domain-containing protein [Candidatus Omnitrophica bacterium]|nr:HD domain-containing protein [Candidatus Omnitrophota bacterium]MCM8824508.1 HD domain-containing protein [Candidatus Omnitrophota bacterium]MCM8826135.1 HD domain-containing protein [Candidatus Omnitrophota bacterium]